MGAEEADAFSPDVAYALGGFPQADVVRERGRERGVWDKAMGRVLKGEAAMTIMGDWAKGYANAPGRK